MKTIQEQKAEYTLNKVFRYEEGIMTRKEWLRLQLTKGATVQIGEKTRNQYSRTKFNRMTGREQEEYYNKCNEKVSCFELVLKGGMFYEITRAEYDYFNNVLLAEQIRSEQMDIPNRIDAGIATEEQIAEYMQPDIDFFNKYCK